MEVERRKVDIRFSCRSCRRIWTEAFERVRWVGYEGDVAEEFLDRGVPVPPPQLGRHCPFCGGLAVDWLELPAGTSTAAAAGTGADGRPAGTARAAPAVAGRRRSIFVAPMRPQREPRTRRFP